MQNRIDKESFTSKTSLLNPTVLSQNASLVLDMNVNLSSMLISAITNFSSSTPALKFDLNLC
jgi:hypothetical protein